MKKLDRSDKEHLDKICNDMFKDLANANIIVSRANKDDYPQFCDIEKVERAVEKIAIFVAMFPFLHAYTDYTNIIRHIVQTLNEYDDPSLTEEN
jgi:hypothetical protein